MATAENDEMMTLLESLRNTLVSRATGGAGDDATFITARRKLIAHPTLRVEVPRWLKACHDLGDFWGMIKPKLLVTTSVGSGCARNWLRYSN